MYMNDKHPNCVVGVEEIIGAVGDGIDKLIPFLQVHYEFCETRIQESSFRMTKLLNGP